MRLKNVLTALTAGGRGCALAALLLVIAACSQAPPERSDETRAGDRSAQDAPRDDAPQSPLRGADQVADARDVPDPNDADQPAVDAAPPAAPPELPPPATSPETRSPAVPTAPAPRESAQRPVGIPSAPAADAAEAAEAALQVHVMTFNIRYETERDGDNRWELRRAHAIEVMRRDRLDFLGMQEVRPAQRTQVAEAMPEWEMFGRGTGRLADRGDASPILYLRERWRLDDSEQGHFWLSETPDEVGAKGWDAVLPRLVTFGRFIERSTGQAVYVFNTHFDHRGGTARQRSAELLAQRVAAVAEQAPVIVMGDFNTSADGSVMAPLRRIGLVHSLREHRNAHPGVLAPGASGTFHAFSGQPRSALIDAIFVPEGSIIEQAEVITESREARYPSDHFPVTMRAKLPAVDP